MLRLAVVIEGETQYLPPLRDGSSTLGSSRDNDLIVNCRGVSRRHAIVDRQGKRVTIIDAGSKNGLLVGGNRVAKVTFAKGIEVVIGTAVLRLEEVASAEGEMAMLLHTLSDSRDASLGALTETMSPISDTARRLLRWVRAADGGEAPLGELLSGARNILAASSLIIFRESVIAEISGGMPSPDAVRELAAPAHGRWIVADAGDRRRVCAYYAEGAPSGWRSDFLTFLASRLHGPSAPVPSVARRSLVFDHAIVRGSSKAMEKVYEQVHQAIESDLNVLLLGESGTGKEVIARLIHESDPSRTGEFIAVNVTAVAPSLLEAELFGVAAGTATDVKARAGAFRAAHRGTILLDEVGDMPPALQAKLLRVVESHAVTPVGTSGSEAVNVRIVSATNHDLQKLVRDRVFRQDLFFRLNGITLTLPSLRERLEDLPELICAFAASASRRFKRSVQGLTPGAMQALHDYPWPGNVRELKTVIERAVLACPHHGAIDSKHILPSLHKVSPPSLSVSSLERQLSTAEASAIEAALRAANDNRSEAARILGVSRPTLYKKMKEYGIR